MKLTYPKYDRELVNRAGKKLLATEGASDSDLATINNWRSAHGYPLQIVKMTLKNRAKRINPNAIISQRLKRLPSIQTKLARERSMSLTQMQDIGGCRAVLSDIKQVRALHKMYEEATAKNPTGRPALLGKKDYISHPKSDGYRGIHLILKFHSKSEIHAIFNGQKIEVQIRTRLQHAWATTVEIVDAFTNQAIKADLKLNSADSNWKKFFALASTAMADMESSPIVPGTIAPGDELRAELKSLATTLNVWNLLRGMRDAITFTVNSEYEDVKDATSYLLTLNLSERSVIISPFGENDDEEAANAYLAAEKDFQTDSNVLVVLVSADSLGALRTAFPNYYLDASAFLSALDEVMNVKNSS